MDVTKAQDFIRRNHRAVLSTRRSDGAPQMSPVSVGVDSVQGDGPSFVGRVSDSGSQFAWESDAQNLVPDDGDGHRDVFFRSIALGGTTERVSVDLAGGDSDGFNTGSEINGSATEVAFSSEATDLVAGDTDGATDSIAYVGFNVGYAY